MQGVADTFVTHISIGTSLPTGKTDPSVMTSTRMVESSQRRMTGDVEGLAVTEVLGDAVAEVPLDDMVLGDAEGAALLVGGVDVGVGDRLDALPDALSDEPLEIGPGAPPGPPHARTRSTTPTTSKASRASAMTRRRQ